MPYGCLEELSPMEFGWLLEGYYNNQREELELLSHVIKVSVATVQSGKKIELFKSKTTKQDVKVYASKEDKLKDFAELQNMMM